MSSGISNWSGWSTSSAAGYVHFVCSVDQPSGGIQIIFTDQFEIDAPLLSGHDATLVGLWKAANMLETEQALRRVLGVHSRKSIQRLMTGLLNLNKWPNASSHNAIAITLIRGAISSLAQTLMASGLNIEPYEAIPPSDDSALHGWVSLAEGDDLVAQPGSFDSEIEAVCEFSAEKKLVYYLKCASTAGQNQSTRLKTIVFTGYRACQMGKAAPTDGPLTLIDVVENRSVVDGNSFEIKTNAGSRFISAEEAYVTRSLLM